MVCTEAEEGADTLSVAVDNDALADNGAVEVSDCCALFAAELVSSKGLDARESGVAWKDEEL